MKGLKLIALILCTMTLFSIDASAQQAQSQVKVEKIATLKITPITISSTSENLESNQAIAQRRKVSSTLRKPIGKKWKSKNWNMC